MTDIEQFRAAVESAAGGTPYVVERTDAGFDVKVDVADAKWYALLYKERVQKVVIHHVALDERTGRYAVTDDSRELQWRAGAEVDGRIPRPVLGGSFSRQIGTIREVSFRRTYAWNKQGEYEKVLDYSFRSSDGNRLIDDAAKELGLTQRLPTVSWVGLGFAVVGGVGALITLVVLVVLAVQGAF